MIGFLIPYIDWSTVIGMATAAGICASAWLSDRAQARREAHERSTLVESVESHDLDLRELRRTCEETSTTVRELSRIAEAHGQAITELKNER